MTVLSGRDGAALVATGAQHTCKNWKISRETNAPSYRASNTLSGTGRVKGVEDWTGSFEQITLLPLLWPGDRFLFRGFTGPSSGVFGENGTEWVGLAMVNEVELTWNWRDNEIPMAVTSFEGAPLIATDLLTLGTAQRGDVSIAEPQPICGLHLEYDIGGGDQVWPNVARATLRLTSENPSYINSSNHTPGPPARCWVSRVPGPLDFELSVLEDNIDHTTLFPIEMDTDVKITMTTGEFTAWVLKWAKFVGVQDLTVDMETQKVTDQTLLFRMNGFSGGAVGNIFDAADTPVLKWGINPA